MGSETEPSWLDRIGALRRAGTPCVLVVVTEVDGSAPREPGARMLVAGGKLAWGTIGGGNLEKLAIEHALAILDDPERPAESVSYPLAEKTGQCCGGRVSLFFEPQRWTRRTVAIFGAGHVGQALARLAPWLDARVMLIDGRHEEELVPALTEDEELPFELSCVDAPEGELDELPDDSLVVVMTHNHALDLEIVERALRRGTFPYLGLIGSERKWQRFRKRLEQRGFSEEDLAAVTCPIGVGAVSKEPSSIALATATQLAEVLASAPV